MAITFTADGPIDRFLRVTGKTREEFERALKAGDVGAVSLFGSETVFSAVSDLIVAVENLTPRSQS